MTLIFVFPSSRSFVDGSTQLQYDQCTHHLIFGAEGALQACKLPMDFPYALLVDNDQDYALLLETVLSGAGVQVVAASSTRHALHLAKINPPSAVLLDLDRPPRESMRLLGDIRGLGSHPKILWISSSVTEAAIQRVVASGAQGLLARNADTVQIVCAVRTILAGEQYFPPIYKDGPASSKREAAESERIMKLLHVYAREG